MSIVAESYSGKFRPKLFVTEGKKELKAFLAAPKTASWVETDDGLEAATDVEVVGPRFAGGANVFRLTTEPWEATCLWNARTSDELECLVEVKIRVAADSRPFLNVWAAAIRANERLSSVSVENRLSREFDAEVSDRIKRHSLAALTRDAALPNRWWAAFCEQRVAKLGLTFDSVVEVVYSAPTEEKRRELERREEERVALLEQKKRDAETERAIAEIDAESAERKRELEHNAFLSNARREEERKRVTAEAEVRKTELARQAELARLEYERKRIELEQGLAETKRRPEEREALKEEMRRVGDRIDAFAKQTNDAINALREIVASKSSQTSPSSQLAMFLVGASDETLYGLGAYRTKAFFSRLFNEKAEGLASSRVRTRLEKSFTTRDATYKKEILSLRIGDSMALEIVSPLDGYVSVLNLGTSGTYWLLAPNRGVGPSETRVRKGESVRVPSDKLYRGELYEGGPGGWEEFVVLVSKAPLFADEERFNDEDFDNPFAKLSAKRLNRLLEQLAKLDANDWAVGTVGVNVVDA